MPSRRRLLLALAAAPLVARPAIAALPPMTFFTENAEPYNFRDGERIVGIGGDMVHELARRSGIAARIEMLPWARAYQSALDTPNSAVFSTFRTEPREALFHWVGRVVDTEWALFARRGTQLRLANLEAARGMTIAGSPEHAPTSRLAAQGFTIEMAPSHETNVRKLQAGRLELWGTANPAASFIARRLGVEIEPVVVFHRVAMEIAVNLRSDAAAVAALREAYGAMERDGSVAAIRARYIA